MQVEDISARFTTENAKKYMFTFREPWTFTSKENEACKQRYLRKISEKDKKIVNKSFIGTDDSETTWEGYLYHLGEVSWKCRSN